MNGKTVGIIVASIGGGFLAGYLVGAYTTRNKTKESDESANYIPQGETLMSTPKETVAVNAAKLATPESKGVNYTAYNKAYQEALDKQKYRAESEFPKEGDGNSDKDDGVEFPKEEDYEETYDERVQREAAEEEARDKAYMQKHKNDIKAIPKEEYESDAPDILYIHETLYAYPDENPRVVTTDTNKEVNEQEYCGLVLQRLGFWGSDQDEICIRNNPKQRDYLVQKREGLRSEYF